MKIKTISILLVVCVLISSFSLAETNNDRADLVFSLTRATLLSNKTLRIVIHTREENYEIGVDSCELQISSGSSWSLYCSLPAPSYVENYSESYAEDVDYSSYIGTGKYRVKLVVYAISYSNVRTNKTIYSNALTF